jgi:aminoglycoside phosphotransferase (APT) family kinase protein
MKQQSDRPLDEQMVSQLVATQFPELRGQPVRRLGAGWDSELYGVGGEWILRFPRRADRVAWLAREITIMGLVSEKLAPRVPVFELMGQPSEAFPYPFAGYRRLAGVGADQIPAAARTRLATDIGAAVQRAAPDRPRPGAADPGRLGARTVADAARWPGRGRGTCRPLLTPALRAQAEPYLAGQVPEPPGGPRRFIHNDICADHLLADPGTGRSPG